MLKEEIGLWRNKRDVETGLQKISTKTEKLRVLKVQIKFRQKVLVQSTVLYSNFHLMVRHTRLKS